MTSPSPQFPATRWSLVQSVQSGQETAAAQALEDLCRAYWYPLYAHVRRRGRSPQDAEDLTQAFFHHLIQRDTLSRVEIDSRKLRSFLLKSLDFFLSSERRREVAGKRGGGRETVSFDRLEAESLYQEIPADSDDPARAFERCWAQSIFRRALESLEREFLAKDEGETFGTLKEMLLPGARERSHRELAREMNVSEGAARVALFRSRQRFGEILRGLIADTVTTREEVDEEIAHLIKALSDR